MFILQVKIKNARWDASNVNVVRDNKYDFLVPLFEVLKRLRIFFKNGIIR